MARLSKGKPGGRGCRTIPECILTSTIPAVGPAVLAQTSSANFPHYTQIPAGNQYLNYHRIPERAMLTE
jgi:hypothetical protein